MSVRSGRAPVFPCQQEQESIHAGHEVIEDAVSHAADRDGDTVMWETSSTAAGSPRQQPAGTGENMWAEVAAETAAQERSEFDHGE